MLENKSILITGGTGSFGNKFIPMTIEKYNPKTIIIYSRDEMKQWDMSQKYLNNTKVKFVIGDVRDLSRLTSAMEGVDFVVHAAATKIVPTAEYNPFECIKTNINGAMNVIDAALSCNVKRVVALSTDKASNPINLYGATKLASDKLFVAANSINNDLNRTIFSVVRYGNVMGSRGSVIPFFLEKKKTGVLPITDPAMTRFNISLQEGVDMVLWALENSCGGEIFVPKIPSYRITDVAKAIGPECEHRVVGIRPGEKIHEEMITISDSFNAVDLGVYYAILSQSGETSIDQYCKKNNATKLTPGVAYSSDSNTSFLKVEEIRNLICQHIDPNFIV